jgi:hypothetical protein
MARLILLLSLIIGAVLTVQGDVVSDYQAKTGKLSEDAVSAEIEKHPERWTKISMKVRFRIDPAGGIHDIQIVSFVANRWAEDAARQKLSALKLPPVPKQVMREAGMDGCYASTQVVLAKTESDFRQLVNDQQKSHK